MRTFENRFEFYIDAPGIDPHKIELTLEAGVLTLSGERSEQASKARGEEPQYRRTEAKAMPRRIQIAA